MTHTHHTWWQREDLSYHQDGLHFAGRNVAELAHQAPSPAFYYSLQRVQQNLCRLHGALESAGFGGRSQILYAMKANRFAPLLTALAQSGECGIDACSPAEVELALSCGFPATNISLTATSLSGADFDTLARIPGLHVNLDSLHALRQWGLRAPNTTIGIRVNPASGVSRESNEKLQYAGTTTTKFGIYQEQFEEALGICGQFGLNVSTIHFHTGCGYLTPQLERWESVLTSCLWFLDRTPGLRRVNIGGGLGVPHLPGEAPLNLDRWGDILREYFGSREVTLQVEPGDYIVKDAGLLLVEITYDEIKRDKRFVGVNAGFNIAPEPAHYGLPFQPVAIQPGDSICSPTTVVGNINEALDVWYEDLPLPPLEGQTHLAILHAGAYSSSMASNHCMRGGFREFLLL